MYGKKTRLMLVAEERVQESLETFLVRMYPHQELRELAERLGVPKATVYNWILKLGLHPEKRLLMANEYIEVKQYVYYNGNAPIPVAGQEGRDYVPVHILGHSGEAEERR